MAGTAEGSRSPSIPRGCSNDAAMVVSPGRDLESAPAVGKDDEGDAPTRGGARTERIRERLRRDDPGARRSAARASPPDLLSASHTPGGPCRRASTAHDLGAL